MKKRFCIYKTTYSSRYSLECSLQFPVRLVFLVLTSSLNWWYTGVLVYGILIMFGNGTRTSIRTKQRTRYTDKKIKCPYTEALHFVIWSQRSWYKDSLYTETCEIKLSVNNLSATWIKKGGLGIRTVHSGLPHGHGKKFWNFIF